jgi:hypothetical protein
MPSHVREIFHVIKPRLAAVGIGLAAHFARVLALAPILGGLVIALTMATGLTGLGERLEWLFGPIYAGILPEELQSSFSGGLMEFGLPIAWKHVGWVFWVCLILSVVEHFTGTEWRKRLFAFKYWAAAFGAYFLIISILLFFFHRVEGSFLQGVFIFSALNGVLYVATLGGLGAFKVIGLVEHALVEKVLRVGEIQGQEAPEHR